MFSGMSGMFSGMSGMDQECALPLIPNAEWSGMFSGMFRNMRGLITECSGMFSGMFGYWELYAFNSSHP